MYSFYLLTQLFLWSSTLKNNLLGTTLIVATSSRTFGGPLGFTVSSTHLSWTSCRKSVCVICKCKVFICPHAPRLSGLLSWSELKKKPAIKFNFLRTDIRCHRTFMISYYIVFYHNLNQKNPKTNKLRHMFSKIFITSIQIRASLRILLN